MSNTKCMLAKIWLAVSAVITVLGVAGFVWLMFLGDTETAAKLHPGVYPKVPIIFFCATLGGGILTLWAFVVHRRLRPKQ